MLTIPKPKETLDFTVEGADEVWSIPYAKDLPIDFATRMAALADAGTMEVLDFLKEVMERFAPGAWENLTQQGLELILDAWKGGLGE